jgi:prepilin-type N-terminal cleavage/methylation domain-containing protein
MLVTRHPSLVTRRRPAAFTLIELLVVIAIIAILAGLGFAGMQGALESGRKAQARTDVQQIVAAVKAYQVEYGRLPSANVAANNSEEATKGWFSGEDNATIIRVLTGENFNNLNPRQISFLDAKTTTSKKGGVDPVSKVFYDPWGNPYFIKLDVSYDGKLEYYGTGNQENVFSAAMAGSPGPDGEQSNPLAPGADDIVSFK